MHDPEHKLSWLEEKVEGKRRSRSQTLASIVSGAATEWVGPGEHLKANTVEKRVLSLSRFGNHSLQTVPPAIPIAVQALRELPA